MSADLITKARAARAAGNATVARALYARAGELARTAGDELTLCHALRHVSDLDREAGDIVSAAHAADEAVAICRTNGAAGPLEFANALRLSALAHDALSDGAAPACWREARDAYREAGIDAAVKECSARLGESSL
ncbi:MAG TPA: hypothetical protein VFV70_12455 [Hyphomonadaceae bacterium]|nr:hypothetical protein [Hyphomonadaceae bacterium]